MGHEVSRNEVIAALNGRKNPENNIQVLNLGTIYFREQLSRLIAAFNSPERPLLGRMLSEGTLLTHTTFRQRFSGSFTENQMTAYSEILGEVQRAGGDEELLLYLLHEFVYNT